MTTVKQPFNVPDKESSMGQNLCLILLTAHHRVTIGVDIVIMADCEVLTDDLAIASY